MFHKTFKRAVYIGIGACAMFALMRPPLTASAATTQGDAAAVSASNADLEIDPTAANALAALGRQAIHRTS